MLRWVALLFLLGSTSAVAQQPVRLAQTGCLGGVPHTQLLGGLDSTTIQGQILLAHESVHRRQLTPDALGTCEEKLQGLLSNPERLLDAEAEAYCAQSRFAAQLLHAQLEYWVAGSADVMHRLFYPVFTLDQVVRALRRYCPVGGVDS